MRRLALAALFALVIASPATAQYVQDNKPDAFLLDFIGGWTGTPTGGNSLNREQHVIVRWELQRRYLYMLITERTRGQAAILYQSAMYVGYDPEAKHYDAYLLDTIGFTHYTGEAKGKKLVLTAGSPGGRMDRLTFTIDSPTEFHRLHETSQDGTTFTPFMSTQYARQGPVPAKPMAPR